jgi:5-methylcytosine-specific restriction enzyme subunit McrC
MITTEIPVKNYFFLLSYAWDMLRENSYLKVDYESCSTPNDLFARILINGLNILIKKGLKKDYKSLTEPMGYLRGKILITESLPLIMSQQNKLMCQHHDLTHNVLENQIIFQTARNLQKSDINKHLKNELNKVIRLAADIEGIELNTGHFDKITKGRDRLQSLLLNVCEIVHLASLPNYSSGERIFRDFINDEKGLGRLFESFIYNFYKLNLDKQFSVTKDEISWGLAPLDEVSGVYLPRMRTDVVVQTPAKKIIIDTKFYKNTFQNFHHKDTVHSSNLYQIQSYILNDSLTGDKKNRTGVLLYPTIKETSPLFYKYADGNQLQVHTIDLSKEWHEIEISLLALIGKIAA